MYVFNIACIVFDETRPGEQKIDKNVFPRVA